MHAAQKMDQQGPISIAGDVLPDATKNACITKTVGGRSVALDGSLTQACLKEDDDAVKDYRLVTHISSTCPSRGLSEEADVKAFLKPDWQEGEKTMP